MTVGQHLPLRQRRSWQWKLRPRSSPPAEVKELESKLALHSIYFQTARPTDQNPGGELMESQQEILIALATDFQRYLTFRPEAHLILGGHADNRGRSSLNDEWSVPRASSPNMAFPSAASMFGPLAKRTN
jgi:outer membrane protein OmpA-like peptidoglycan-associated protein